MAKNAGTQRQRFIDKHATLIDDVQRKLLLYVKTLFQEESSTPAANPHATTSQPVESEVPLERQTEHGFPVMPAMDGKSRKKEEYEELLRWYLGTQYSKFWASH